MENSRCVSTKCLAASLYIQTQMDLDVDPCLDFYRHACGGWLGTHFIPPSYALWNIDSEITKEQDEKIKTILENVETVHEAGSAGLKVRVMYQKCLDEDALDEAGREPVQGVVERLGDWALSGNGHQPEALSATAPHSLSAG